MSLASVRCLLRSNLPLIRRTLCTSTNQPVKHEPSSELVQNPIIGTFQPIKKEDFDRLFTVYGFEPYQTELFEVLADRSIMIRQPFLQLMDYIAKTDFNRPINRYILWGRYGTGKSFILNHLALWGYYNNYALIHFTSPHDWIHEPAEIELSESRPGRLDFPLNAALALKHFKAQNSLLLARSNFRTTKKYTWSIREETEKGEPLVNVIDHGISRIKHAADCYAVLLKELKIQANSGACKIMVLVDSVNIFYEKPSVKHTDGRFASVEELTLSRALMKLFKTDWKNGLVVASTNTKQDDWTNRLNSHYPKVLLGDRGFEDFDPFLPIKVENYSDIEADSLLDYYTENMFLQRPATRTPEGREEIKAVNARNPLEMFKFCAPL